MRSKLLGCWGNYYDSNSSVANLTVAEERGRQISVQKASTYATVRGKDAGQWNRSLFPQLFSRQAHDSIVVDLRLPISRYLPFEIIRMGCFLEFGLVGYRIPSERGRRHECASANPCLMGSEG